jgi:hypothetical protein
MGADRRMFGGPQSSEATILKEIRVLRCQIEELTKRLDGGNTKGEGPAGMVKQE